MTARLRTPMLPAIALFVALAGCDKPAPPDSVATATAPTVPGASSSAATAPAGMLPQMDVGKLDSVKVTADGYGANASAAVAEAMKMAVLQVNGAALDMRTVDARLGLDVVTSESITSLRASGFADAVRTRSGGVIQNLRIVNMDEPLLPNGRFKATVEASIARFAAPKSLDKVKLVIAPLRFDRATVPVGDRNVPSTEIAAELRQRILDALDNTGRFAVLDRDFDPDIQQELDMIANGDAPSAEVAKLSQAVTADVIWSGRVNGFAYNRSARQLRASDRQLVSYSGGWSVSQKMVNVATRQVVTAETLHGEAPSTAPTTLGSGVDSRRVMAGMTDDLVNQVVASILLRSFPITVVSLDGSNVILSQGGKSLRPGARYAMVVLGAELKDPQTGQSLGRVESDCCQLVVDRVAPNLSYGHLEAVTRPLDALPPGAMQVRGMLASAGALHPVAVDSAPVAPASSPSSTAATSARKARPPTGESQVAAPVDRRDEKW